MTDPKKKQRKTPAQRAQEQYDTAVRIAKRLQDQHTALAAELDRAKALRDLLGAGVSLQTCRQVIDQVLTTGTCTVGAITITRTPGDAA